jgi:hypothetical protein
MFVTVLTKRLNFQKEEEIQTQTRHNVRLVNQVKEYV